MGRREWRNAGKKVAKMKRRRMKERRGRRRKICRKICRNPAGPKRRRQNAVSVAPHWHRNRQAGHGANSIGGDAD
jgi:hypothetical protein